MNRKLRTILCGLLSAAMITAVILPLSGCEKKDEGSSQTAPGDAVESSAEVSETVSEIISEASAANEVKGDLQGVLDSLKKEDSSYSEYKSFFTTAEFTEEIKDNKLVITIKGEGEYDPNGTWEFVQDGDYLTYQDKDTEDYVGVVLFMDMAQAVADSLGMDKELMSGYLNGITAMEIESDKFVLTKNDDGTNSYKLYMAAPFEMKELDDIYIGGTLLEDVEPLTDEHRSQTFSVGKIAAIMNGDKSGVKILIREYGELDDLAVKSVVNIFNAFQPDGYESFAENFTAFEDVTTDEYTVKKNADEADITEYFQEKKDGYSYGCIIIGKEEAEEEFDIE